MNGRRLRREKSFQREAEEFHHFARCSAVQFKRAVDLCRVVLVGQVSPNLDSSNGFHIVTWIENKLSPIVGIYPEPDVDSHAAQPSMARS